MPYEATQTMRVYSLRQRKKKTSVVKNHMTASATGALPPQAISKGFVL